MEAVNQAGTARLSKRLRRKRAGRRWGNVFAVAVFTFIYIPIAMMVLFSFNDQRTNYYWNGFTLDWYKYLFTQSDLWGYLVISLIVAVASVILSLAVGVLGAMGLMRFEFRLKTHVDHSEQSILVFLEHFGNHAFGVFVTETFSRRMRRVLRYLDALQGFGIGVFFFVHSGLLQR